MSGAPTADPGAETTVLPPKVDPEALVLRGRPGRVVRFRRSVVVGLAVAALCGVVGAAWLALKPRTFQIVAQQEDATEPAKAPAEALGALPLSYADAPKLGPPLPGDLGRPILERQRSLGAAEIDGGVDRRQEALQAERERLADERRKARESGVLAPAIASGAALPRAGAAEPSSAPSRSPSQSAGEAGVAAEPAAPETALDGEADVNPHRIRPASSPYLLSAGSVIAASLITGLRSDLPGLAIAQVTERVYDSPTGRLLLIPQGARLVGTYDSKVAFGQRRARLVWQRIVFPGGRSLHLDDVPASDAGGYAGLEDEVDFHTWSLVKGAAISTLLGVGANLTFSGESDVVQAIRESSQQNVSRAGDQLTSKNLQIQPTITVRPGTPVRLVVRRDLVLAPPEN